MGTAYGRSFDDVDDEITCAISSAGVTGAFTIAAMFRVRASSEAQPVFGMFDGSNVRQLTLEVTTSGAPQAGIANVNRSAEAVVGADVFFADQWVIVAIAKAAGPLSRASMSGSRLLRPGLMWGRCSI